MPTKYRIHPAIGIARVGDSPDDFFVGPEAPGVAPMLNEPDGTSSQPGKYKDQMHRIKRQGARFRIYEYTEGRAGVVTKVREVTAADAQIEWEVHLVNRKAAEKTRFFTPPDNSKSVGRNADVTDRSKLIIDPGPQRISGVNQPMKALEHFPLMLIHNLRVARN
ncbi:MAG: LodA/GoxA family CTQ-dependent oxidase [Chloroflexota bacterium]